MKCCRTFTMAGQMCSHFDSVYWPNKPAARERRDCALVLIEDHCRGVGEPGRAIHELVSPR